jgi:hypothetical protein
MVWRLVGQATVQTSLHPRGTTGGGGIGIIRGEEGGHDWISKKEICRR